MPRDEMPITLAGLVDALGAQLIRPLTDGAAKAAPVSVPVIYDPADEIPDVPGGVLLLVGLRPDDESAALAIDDASHHGFSAVVIKLRGQSPDRLLRRALEASCAVLAVDDAVPWRQLDRLITVVVGGGSGGESGDAGQELFVLADAIAAAVDGAVAIEDLDRNVLAYSNLERHTVDRMRRNGILARRVPDMDKNLRQYRDVMQADGVVHFPFDSADGELPRCAAAVRAGHQAVGTIWVIEQDSALDSDAAATLLDASRLAAVYILRLQSAVDVDRQVRGEWLRTLLEGHTSGSVAAARFGLTPALPSVLVGFLLRADDQENQPLTRQLASAVEQYCTAFRTTVPCVSIGHIVYVLFPSVRDLQMPHRLAKGAATALEARLGYPVLVASSTPECGIDQLPALRREVDDVLDVQSGHPDAHGVATARDVYAELLLRRLGAEITSDDRNQHPEVRTLLEHDRAHGTAYRETLCAYFAAMGDIGIAAGALRLHPNTVRYRIRRAEDLFGLRLDNADDTLVTWLAIRVAQNRDLLRKRPI